MGDEKLMIEFGVPSHGWLPVEIRRGDFHLAFVASNVPENPIDQLISNLLLVSKGIQSETFWLLEPEGHWFEFNKVGNGYEMKISSAAKIRARREMIYSVAGSEEEVIYRFTVRSKSSTPQVMKFLIGQRRTMFRFINCERHLSDPRERGIHSIEK